MSLSNVREVPYRMGKILTLLKLNLEKKLSLPCLMVRNGKEKVGRRALWT